MRRVQSAGGSLQGFFPLNFWEIWVLRGLLQVRPTPEKAADAR